MKPPLLAHLRRVLEQKSRVHVHLSALDQSTFFAQSVNVLRSISQRSSHNLVNFARLVGELVSRIRYAVSVLNQPVSNAFSATLYRKCGCLHLISRLSALSYSISQYGSIISISVITSGQSVNVTRSSVNFLRPISQLPPTHQSTSESTVLPRPVRNDVQTR